VTVLIRRASTADRAVVLGLVRAFYEHDGYPYDEELVTGALVPLLEDDTRGLVWLALDPASGDALAYAVLTWGWSLESGGPEAVLDELYADRRGEGVGGQLLDHVLTAARELGTRRIFIETERRKDDTRRFYTRHGFSAEESIWMKIDL
jgi:GNAT superfamily N-acetyltransferase